MLWLKTNKLNRNDVSKSNLLLFNIGNSIKSKIKTRNILPVLRYVLRAEVEAWYIFSFFCKNFTVVFTVRYVAKYLQEAAEDDCLIIRSFYTDIYLHLQYCTDRSRVFVRSQAPFNIYTDQSTLIRISAFGVGHRASDGVGHLTPVGTP